MAVVRFLLAGIHSFPAAIASQPGLGAQLDNPAFLSAVQYLGMLK